MSWLCHGYVMAMSWLYHGYTVAQAVSVGDKATSLREMIEKRTSGTSMISTNHSEVLPPRKSTDGRRKVSMSVRDRGQSARSSEGTRSTSSDNERRKPRSKVGLE